MSNIKHATVSAWQRDHDGTYSAEINGYTLKVVWQPENDVDPRGFRWVAVSPEGTRLTSDGTHEEIELAMAEAEAATEPKQDPAGEEAA